jgi:hypothetical protein
MEAYNGMNQLSTVGTTNHVALKGNCAIYRSFKIFKRLQPFVIRLNQTAWKLHVDMILKLMRFQT